MTLNDLFDEEARSAGASEEEIEQSTIFADSRADTETQFGVRCDDLPEHQIAPLRALFRSAVHGEISRSEFCITMVIILNT
jgi:hypothetical protein